MYNTTTAYISGALKKTIRKHLNNKTSLNGRIT